MFTFSFAQVFFAFFFHQKREEKIAITLSGPPLHRIFLLLHGILVWMLYNHFSSHISFQFKWNFSIFYYFIFVCRWLAFFFAFDVSSTKSLMQQFKRISKTAVFVSACNAQYSLLLCNTRAHAFVNWHCEYIALVDNFSLLLLLFHHQFAFFLGLFELVLEQQRQNRRLYAARLTL